MDFIKNSSDLSYLLQVYCQMRKEMETERIDRDTRENMDGIRHSIHNYLANKLLGAGLAGDFQAGRRMVTNEYKKLEKDISVPHGSSFYLDKKIFKILNN